MALLSNQAQQTKEGLKSMDEVSTEKIIVDDRKKEYIKNLRKGTILAFRVKCSEKVLSAMVIEINIVNITVETKNGTKFIIDRDSILWVKTGERWPKGIYNLLKEGFGNGKH